MRRLWPEIEVIRQRLLGPEAESAPAVIEEELVDAQPLPMPAVVAEQIQRLSTTPREARPLKPGDVVLLRKTGHAPIAVCLDTPISKTADATRWRSWMVAAEADYATDKDVLLEEIDGPCDPLAGMIQTWNPLEVVVPETATVLARLSEYRMNLIREVARETGEESTAAPRPGFVANRETESGRIVLTGTPLSKANDPRIEFREIYQSCANVFAVAASLARQAVERPAESNQTQAGLLSSLSAWLLGHRLAVGATAAVAVISGVVVSQMLPDTPIGIPTPMASVETPKVSTPPSPPPEVAVSPQEKKVDEPNKAPPPTTKAEKPIKPEKSKAQQPAPTQLANAPDDILKIRTLLVPLKDQTVVLAMRSGGGEQADVKAYRIRLKPGADIDRAIEVLMNLGFRIVKVEEGAAALQVMISESLLTSELDRTLLNADIFDAVSQPKQ